MCHKRSSIPRNSNSPEQKVKVNEIIIHPFHGTNGGFNYDFCLLQTDPIRLNGVTAASVCLPNFGETGTPKNCFVAGWVRVEIFIQCILIKFLKIVFLSVLIFRLKKGLLQYVGYPAVTLQSVGVQVYSDEVCLVCGFTI